ncbi:MAG: RHS repeat-associated core domain-containing protein, partial [Clostridia bacterium]|nr:RHS repeat-associated core domain-containing protein [Clostridia bacterium]
TGFHYDPTTYVFKKNLQGDVNAIYTLNGTKVAEYAYDAWGKCTITYDPTGIGAINPIRYRSYYYDTETGLYYLNSRYYDPNTGRFVNADVYVSTGIGLLNCNMYAYCHNNPIVGIDPTGKRTYILNGIANDNLDRPPEYIETFQKLLAEAGIDDVRTIPLYTGQVGIRGTVKGAIQVVSEMLNVDIYTDLVVNKILADLKNDPLEDGEQLNLIGYSGGGQVALNVMEKMNGKISNVILIGTPVCEIWKNSTKVTMVYGGFDPLSWNIGHGYKSYFMGWFGHWVILRVIISKN